jgi:hypothetical protein
MSWIRKSQLAIEYSYRVRKQSQQKWVFWIPASNTAKFQAAYKNIAARVQLPRSDGTTANVLQLVYDWLCNENNGQWLMIVDNADDESIFGTIRQDGQGAAPGDSPVRSTLASLLHKVTTDRSLSHLETGMSLQNSSAGTRTSFESKV